MMKLYGVPGWGSAISEMMLTLADIPYQFINVDGFDQPGAQREKLLAINPLCQVPTLLLVDGCIMTESAAIALMILDKRPDLAPPAGTPERRQFQRLLIWLVANVYPTFTYADYPERWTLSAPDELRESCQQYRKSLYLWLEQQLTAAPYALGGDITLLDCYIAAMYSWGPRREWFVANTPKFAAVAQAVYCRTELQQVLRDNNLL
ncbi:glutathione S-transferase family protein [Klebsiella aerogenes]|uniref:glutathione S-transferase family protein n=1 Tax=Klebsiella aerogenes TaxID=548 RepID=UPI00397D8882|nr:glutathione S-transferase family protein [Klebsiella aerogenes]